MDKHSKLATDLLDYVHKLMSIDERWTVREPLGFTWWGHRLAQRVWAEPLSELCDPAAVRMQAETAFLRHAPDTLKARLAIDLLNVHTSLNSFLFDRESGRVTVRCSGYVNEETVGWVRQLLGCAVAIQVADAHAKAAREDALTELVGGEVDVSHHPRAGPRVEPDDMLNVLPEMFGPIGMKPSPFTGNDFEEMAKLTPSPSVLTNASETGLTAEFPYWGSIPGVLTPRGQDPQTALLTVDSRERHPQLGSGVLWRLSLPTFGDEDEEIEKAIALNCAEVPTDPRAYLYGFGAWCRDRLRNTLAYVMFMPAAAYAPGILQPFFWTMAARTRWAQERLHAGQTPNSVH